MEPLPPAAWLETAIRIDSITDRSNEAMVRFLAPLLEGTGLKVREHRVREKGQSFFNLVATSHGLTSPGLLVLNTHLDTVPFGDRAAWTSTGGDPFRLTRDGDRLHGLGAADVKLDFLCKIWAVKHARRNHRPLALVGTYGEERGLVGARKLLESGKLKPRFALVGEPSNLELIYAHKGHLLYELRVPLGKPRGGPRRHWTGKAAHSSTPHLGDNALEKAIAEVAASGGGIRWLEGGNAVNTVPEACTAEVSPEANDGVARLRAVLDVLADTKRALARKRDARFDPASATLSLNWAVMKGTECQLTFDVRLLPDTDATTLKKKLRAGLKKAGARVVGEYHDPALRGRKTTRFMKAALGALASTGARPAIATKATSTEAALYATHGAEAAVFGPGISIGNVHRPNEHNLSSHLEAATRFYRAMLELPDDAF